MVSRGCPGQAPKTSDFLYFKNLLLRRAGCGYVNAVSEEAANLVTVAVSGAFIEGIHMPAFGAGIYKKGGNPKFVLFNLALMPHPDAGYEAWRAVVRCVPFGPGFKVLTAVSQRLGAEDRYCGAGGYTCTLAPAGFRPGSLRSHFGSSPVTVSVRAWLTRQGPGPPIFAKQVQYRIPPFAV